MIFHEILQSLGQTFDAAAVAAWMEGVKVGAGALVGVTGDGLWGASWAGTIPGVGKLVTCGGGDPARRLVQQVGGGSSGGRSWMVWRITDWEDKREPLSEDQRLVYQARATFLRKWLREAAEERAKYPDRPARPWEEFQAELDNLEWLLSPIGGLFVVAYVGYGRRWAPNQYVLRI
jgi:hypothetical protein